MTKDDIISKKDLEEAEGSGTASNDDKVSTLAIKVPPFWIERPEIWFAQLEAQFQSAKMVSDRQRFNTLLGQVDAKILAQVSDSVLNPPATDKFKHLKEAIITCFADSEQKKTKKLISDMVLGDRKPSQLLSEMRALAGQSITEDFLKTLWLQRLPVTVQAILSANDIDLKASATLADKISEVVEVRNVSAVNQPTSSVTSEIAALRKQVETLTKTCEKMAKSENRGRGRSTSRNKGQPPANQEKNQVCYYHRKFGDQAWRCRKPCAFKKSEQKN